MFIGYTSVLLQYSDTAKTYSVGVRFGVRVCTASRALKHYGHTCPDRRDVAIFTCMSTQEIMAELTKLSRADLEQLDERLHELLKQDTKPSSKSWADALSELAGTAEGLPEDFAQHHDHYLHGAPKG